MSPTQEKLPNQIPRTAEEMLRAQDLARERKERGDREAMTQLSSQMEGFIQNATPDNLRNFITIVYAGSPEAQEEYGKLCSYFNTKALELAKRPKTGKSPEQKMTAGHQVEHITERPVEPLAFSKFETKGDVNGVSVPMLSTEAYVALKSTETNPDAFARFLASDDLSALESRKRQGRDELEKQKIYIVNSGNYPQGWDSAINLHEETFKKQSEAIVAKYRPNTETFKKSLNTDQGRYLLENTERVIIESGIKSNIRKGLGITENTGPKESSGEKLTGEIYGKTTDLLRKIGSLGDSINRDIEAIRAQHTTMLRAGGNEMVYQQAIMSVPDRYETVIRGEVKKYAKDIGKDLILSEPTSQLVLQGQRFSLPVGDKKITLDFGNLGSVSKDKKVLLASFESKFETIYRDEFTEKAFDSAKNAVRYVKDKPWETTIDVGSTIASGVVTGMIVDVSGWVSLLQAWALYTGINNALTGVGYGILGKSRGKDGTTEGFAGIGIQASDTKSDVFRKKSFELASNTALFGIFKTSAIAEHAFRDVVGKLAGSPITPELAKSIMKNPIFKGVDTIGTPILKTWSEAAFFTFYIAASAGVEKAVKQAVDSGLTTKEAIDMVGKELSEIKDPNIFMDLYVYNLGFVTAVKSWVAMGRMPGTAMDKNKLERYSTTLAQEHKRLEAKGYSFASRQDGGFFVFDRYGHKADPKAPEFATFAQANLDVFKLSVKIAPPKERKRDEDIHSPENGRGGKSATNPTNLEQKFVNLARNSTEAEKDGLKYALRDETVYSRLEQTGISDGTAVKEWLMKKSGFEEFEIRDYREGKKEWSNEVEREALTKMEVASEKITREYDFSKDAFMKVSMGKMNINDMKKLLSEIAWLKSNDIRRLSKLIEKEGK